MPLVGQRHLGPSAGCPLSDEKTRKEISKGRGGGTGLYRSSYMQIKGGGNRTKSADVTCWEGGGQGGESVAPGGGETAIG